jgi:hypothetical protein
MNFFLLLTTIFLMQPSAIISSEYRYCNTSKNQNIAPVTKQPSMDQIKGRTLLHDAADDIDRLNEIPMYIQVKMNVNQQDNNGDTPLHLIAAKNTMLINHSSYPNWMDQENKRRLDYLLDNIEALLIAKADVLTRNNNGQTPIDIAKNSDLIKTHHCRDVVNRLTDFVPKK